VKLQLTAVDVHPDFGTDFESHTFECPRCGRAQSYTLRRKSGAGGQPVPAKPAGPRRQRP